MRKDTYPNFVLCGTCRGLYEGRPSAGRRSVAGAVVDSNRRSKEGHSMADGQNGCRCSFRRWRTSAVEKREGDCTAILRRPGCSCRKDALQRKAGTRGEGCA